MAQGLTYDNEGRLSKWVDTVERPNVTQTMAYDGEGQRVALSVNGSTTSYLSNLEEISGSTLTKYMASGPGLPVGVRVGTGDSLLYLATDGQGSVDEALDSNASATVQELFTPYGSVRYSQGARPPARPSPAGVRTMPARCTSGY